MKYEVKGKVCLVTGSAKGLGQEFAQRLLDKGAKVCISDLDEETGNKTVEEFKSIYSSNVVTFAKLNVTDDEDWEKALQHCKDTFGEDVKVLVNNAGLAINASHKAVLDVNCKGLMTGTFKALEIMKNNQGGRIINIASMAGLYCGMGNFKDSAYNVSKHGVVAFTRNFKVCKIGNPSKHHDIRAYAICPWFVQTDMLDTGGTNMAEKIKKVFKIRVLEKVEVGRVMIQALDQDINGAVMSVMPDTPTILNPEWNFHFMYYTHGFAKLKHIINPDCKLVDVKDIVKFGFGLSWLFGFICALILTYFVF